MDDERRKWTAGQAAAVVSLSLLVGATVYAVVALSVLPSPQPLRWGR